MRARAALLLACSVLVARVTGAQTPPSPTQATAAQSQATAAQSQVTAAQTQATAAQTQAGPVPASATTFTVNSSLVLVPALVKTRAGELVFSLSANDFALTDDGIPQKLRLEQDTDTQPLALAVVVQTGGIGATHLRDYRNLDAVLDAVIGDVRHRVAVVSFDSAPHLEQPFTGSTDAAAEALNQLEPGDPGVAILDALDYATALLRRQPPAFRRALLLISETVDTDSKISLEDTLRSIDGTNTSIYSFGFSSTRAAVKREANKLPGGKYSDTPYAAGGCMSRDPNADPDANGKRAVQALDCASDLLPPLRLARMAFLAAKEGLQRNVPESVAQLTGGEYFPFKDARSLNRQLVIILNDVPNHYVLSFVPGQPSPGLHALKLEVKQRPDLDIMARDAYWIDTPATAAQPR
jgi:VWFA-related protein